MTTIPPTKDHLEALRDQGLTREQIAEHFGVPLSQVKRWIANLQVSKKIIRKDIITKPVRPVVVPPVLEDEGLTIMERAKRILGARLTEKRGVGYLLDGRCVSTTTVVEVAGLKFKDHDR